MLPFGYWSNSVLSRDSGTLGSRSLPEAEDAVGGEGHDAFPEAPPEECLEKFQSTLTYRENKSMLDGQLETLREKIEMDCAENLHPNGKNTPQADMVIFQVCNYFKLSDSVKYLSCEVHKRFITKFNEEMKRAINEAPEPNVQQLEMRALELAMLRIGSCIQLASKMNTADVAHLDVSIEDLTGLYQRLKYNFSVEAIQQSELRVFDLLDYNLNIVTTLDVVESILIQLGLTVTEYRQVYETAIYTLDHLYLNRQHIRNVFYNVTSSNCQTRNAIFNRRTLHDAAIAELHKFVEGCAVVLSALLTLRMEAHPAFQQARRVMETREDIHNIENLCFAIMYSTDTRAAAAFPLVDPDMNSFQQLSAPPTPLVSPNSSRTT